MKPAKYRKKPIEVEAMQFKGGPDAALEVIRWILNHDGRASYETVDMDTIHGMIGIQTMKGRMHAVPGDFIVRGMWGEFYPCKPDIFALAYDPSGAASVIISPRNRRIIEQAYDDGDGHTLTLVAGEDPSWFSGLYEDFEVCQGLEHEGVLYTIVAQSDGLVSVIVGRGLIENDGGTTFRSVQEAKTYIQDCIAE